MSANWQPFSPRDRHVAGGTLDWSKSAQAFRKLDGDVADWRRSAANATARRHRTGIRARLRRMARSIQTWIAFERILLGQAGNRRDTAIFLVGCGWGVMCAIGAMAAWGIHP